MAILDYEGLAWFDTDTPASRTILAEYGYSFYNANSRTAVVERNAFFTGVRLLPPTSSYALSRSGSFGRPIPSDYADSVCAAFLVGPDYVQTSDALGFPSTSSAGSTADPANRRQRGIGVQRNAQGQFRFAWNVSTGPSFFAAGSWADLEAQYWSNDAANTIYIVKSGNLYELYVNDSPLVTSETRSLTADLAGLFCLAAPGESTQPFSLAILATQPEGPLAFRYYRPGVDGASDFTPDTGTAGYDRLNELLPDGDDSYVEASDDGARAFYGYVDASGNPIEIQSQQVVHGVRHLLSARVAGADTRYLRALVSDGETQVGVGAAPVRGVYSNRQIDLPSNPLTGLAWQPEDFDSLQLGFQIDDEAE